MKHKTDTLTINDNELLNDLHETYYAAFEAYESRGVRRDIYAIFNEQGEIEYFDHFAHSVIPSDDRAIYTGEYVDDVLDIMDGTPISDMDKSDAMYVIEDMVNSSLISINNTIKEYLGYSEFIDDLNS